nr:hypothetical protein GPGIFMOB_00313 [Acinetobacter gerneri]
MSLARNATASQSPTQTNGYERHQPDQTLLYQLVPAALPSLQSLTRSPRSTPASLHPTRIQRPPPMWPSGVWFHAGSAARIVITSVWSPSAVNDAAFALAAVPAGWPRVRRC